jgi:hypothetical protein
MKADQIGTKADLLATFADGQEHSGWDFASGTLGWAKRNGLVSEIPNFQPRKYVISEKGRRMVEIVRSYGLPLCVQNAPDRVLKVSLLVATSEMALRPRPDKYEVAELRDEANMAFDARGGK